MFTLDEFTSRQNCYVIHRKMLQGYSGILYIYDCSSFSLRSKVNNNLYTCQVNARKILAVVYNSNGQFDDEKLRAFSPEVTIFSPVRLQSDPVDTFAYSDGGVLDIWEREHFWDGLTFQLREYEQAIGLDSREELDAYLIESLPKVGVPESHTYNASDFILQRLTF